MINGSNIRLPNGQFSTLVTPVNKDGVTQLITPVDANGNVITGGGSSDPSQITSETAPTTRADGSALQNGDRWYNPSTNHIWIWSGAVWRSSQVFTLQLNTVISTPHIAIPNAPSLVTHIYVESYILAQQSANTGNNDASNYRTITLFLRRKASGTEDTVSAIQNYPLISGQANTWNNTVNTAYLLTPYSGFVVRELAGAGTNYAYGHYTPIITFRWQFS